MHLQCPCHSSLLLFGKGLTQTLLLQLLSPGRDLGTHVTTCPPSSWKNFLELAPVMLQLLELG